MTRAILLEHGLVVDGSGAEPVAADVLLHDDRIAAVGPALHECLPPGFAPADVQRLDCRGRIVAPGFIDVHTHDDAIVIEAPHMLPKLSQGVTTVITGNCGLSVAPLVMDEPTGALTLLGRHFRYPGVAEYARAVDQARPAVNVAPLIGHTTLRHACMGDLSQAANAAQIDAMCALLDACLRDGAIGLSSGLFYAEAMPAPMAEVVALARVVARHQGVYTTHLRSEMNDILDALREAGDTALAAQVPLIISHHKCAGPANWGRTIETLALIERMAERQPIAMDVYPYTAGSTVLREDLVDGVIDVRISWSAPHPQATGRLLSSLADEWGVSQREACRRLMPGGACYFQMREDDVRRVLAHPRSMVGSDGLPHDRHPHPRLWGTFPRVLGHYCREEQLFTLAEAVRKITGLAASNFHLHERGRILPGWFADVVVFDAAAVRDLATYDHPLRRSEGIERVFVNGQPAYVAEGANPAGPTARAGRVLLRAKAVRASIPLEAHT